MCLVCVCVRVCVCVCVFVYTCMFKYTHSHELPLYCHHVRLNFIYMCCLSIMGWLRLVGSLKLQISFAEYRLCYKALLHKRPIIHMHINICLCVCVCVCVCMCVHTYICMHLLGLDDSGNNADKSRSHSISSYIHKHQKTPLPADVCA